MQIIGLTGSLAAGKSSTAQIFRQMGLPVHDSDKIVHQLLGPNGQAVPKILQKFGAIGTIEAGIDRSALAQIIFTEDTAKIWLEQTLHPLVAQDRWRFIRHHRAWRFRRIVLDVPLLFEVGADALCDVVITVWAPEFIRKNRAMQRPAMSEKKYQSIQAAQIPQAEKRRLSDFSLPSGLGYAETRRRLKRWLCKQDMPKQKTLGQERE